MAKPVTNFSPLGEEDFFLLTTVSWRVADALKAGGVGRDSAAYWCTRKILFRNANEVGRARTGLEWVPIVNKAFPDPDGGGVSARRSWAVIYMRATSPVASTTVSFHGDPRAKHQVVYLEPRCNFCGTCVAALLLLAPHRPNKASTAQGCSTSSPCNTSALSADRAR